MQNINNYNGPANRPGAVAVQELNNIYKLFLGEILTFNMKQLWSSKTGRLYGHE